MNRFENIAKNKYVYTQNMYSWIGSQVRENRAATNFRGVDGHCAIAPCRARDGG